MARSGNKNETTHSEQMQDSDVEYKRIKHLRPLLTEDITQVLVLGLVISHIDYCNSLFVGPPEIDISKLQRIQNVSAKLVLNNTRSYSATETLRQLH